MILDSKSGTLSQAHSEKALIDIQSTGRYGFSSEEFAARTGREPGGEAVRHALIRLRKKQRITQISRMPGYWLILPPEYLTRQAPPVAWWLHDFLSFKETHYYVGLLSAAQYHGSAHFAVMETQVVLPRIRKPLAVGTTRLRFFFKDNARDTPCDVINTEKTMLRVTTPAATLLDLLRHASQVGGIERIHVIAKDLCKKIDARSLLNALNAQAETAAAQRLGYLFDLLGKTTLAAVVDQWLANRSVQVIRLDTSSLQTAASRHPRWNLFVNTILEDVS